MKLLSTDVPWTTINTVEQMLLWCSLLLDSESGNREVIEGDGRAPERLATNPMFTIPGGTIRITPRASLPMSEEVYTSTTKRFWQHAQEIAFTTSVPAGFKP